MGDAGGTLRRPALWLELAGGLAIFGLYLVVESFDGPGRRALADRNGHGLLGLERHLHLDVETWLNRELAPHQALSVIANYEYAFTYIASALAMLIWLYVKRPHLYRSARNSFALLNVVAITIFAVYPVTPPRLLDGAGFVDTVVRGSTWGSWGSPLVSHANQLAAVPSLHVGWALWVSVVLARIASGAVVQVVSAVHVAVTVLVILATANHYLLDAVVAAVLVWLCVAVADPRRGRRTGRRSAGSRRQQRRQQRLQQRRNRGRTVPSADAFFLHVETPQAPQHVGGVVVLDQAPGGRPTLEEVRALVRDELGGLPRFTQRLGPTSRWRRFRWVEAPELDWDWHVCERVVDAPTDEAGVVALQRVVADIATEQLPRDRPMWRIVMVRGIGPGRSGFVIVMHHCVADGIGTVVQALSLMRPRIDLLAAGSADGRARRPNALLSGALTAVGLAQLAADARRLSHPGEPSAARDFATVGLALDTVRDVARRHRARVTDVLLCLVGASMARLHPELTERLGGRLRVSVPLMVRVPGSAEVEGNVTAAVMVDVPLKPLDPVARLAEIGRSTARLRTPTRALGGRFVMTRVLALMPQPLSGWFARSVYGAGFFQAIVSNMPGPTVPTTLAGVGMPGVYPLLPLAPGVPMALGALSWDGVIGVGLAADPAVLDAARLAGEMAVVLRELEGSHDESLTEGVSR